MSTNGWNWEQDCPYIGMQPDEDIAESDDGGVVLQRAGDCNADPAVYLSPVYAAAPAMLAALKRIAALDFPAPPVTVAGVAAIAQLAYDTIEIAEGQAKPGDAR